MSRYLLAIHFPATHTRYLAHFSLAGCCSNNGPGQPSGGLWILEPSLILGDLIWRMLLEGAAEYADGKPKLTPEGKHARGMWRQSDMMVVRHAFMSWDRADRSRDQYWPKLMDSRHGYPSGLRDLPLYRAMSDAEFNRTVTDAVTKTVMPEGLNTSQWNGRSLIWHALPIHYDQCLSNCDCLPWRNNLSMAYSHHYSCLHSSFLDKPTQFDTEEALFAAINGPAATNCIRYFYRDIWYEKYKRAHGRLPPPHWRDDDPRIIPTNTSALMNPPVREYDVDFTQLSRITGWGRRRR